MKEFNCLILRHYNFDAKDGKHVETTKCRVNLGEFGLLDVNSELANNYDEFSVVKVKLGYKNNRPIIAEIVK